MADVTTNGVPFLELADPPNIATGTQGIADWLEDALTATTGQVLHADTTQANDLAWRWPRSRIAAPTPTGTIGDLWTPSSGADVGELFHHNGTSFSRVKPDVTLYSTGELSTVTDGAPDTISSTIPSWSDTSLSITATLSASRRYVAHASVGVTITGDGGGVEPSAYGQMLYGSTVIGMAFAYQEVSRLLSAGQGITFLGQGSSRPFTGTGSSGTVKVQATKASACGLSVGVVLVTGYLSSLWVEDVGPL